MLVQVGPRLLLADEDDDDDDDDDYVPRLMGTDNYESEAWCCASLDRSEYDYAIGPSELEAVAGPHAQALVTHQRSWVDVDTLMPCVSTPLRSNTSLVLLLAQCANTF